MFSCGIGNFSFMLMDSATSSEVDEEIMSTIVCFYLLQSSFNVWHCLMYHSGTTWCILPCKETED